MHHQQRARTTAHRLVPAVLAMTVTAAACAPSGEVVADGPVRAGATTAPPTQPTGPPPVTGTPDLSDLLDSPAAVPNGPGTAPAADGSDEATTDEPTPDDAERVRGTLVAHAITNVVTPRAAPEAGADVVTTLAHPTDRGVPLVFQVLNGPVDGWLEVLLPIRPNGATGWIRADEVELTRNRYRIDLDVGRHRLTLFRDDEVLLRTTVGIGTGATPTPIGDFYLTELLRPPNPDGAYGPYAYGLSGFSETLDSFNGGPGIIGIHGTNEPELLGTDVSHGCVRVHNDVISEMATFLPLGTPVVIHNGERPPPPPGLL